MFHVAYVDVIFEIHCYAVAHSLWSELFYFRRERLFRERLIVQIFRSDPEQIFVRYRCIIEPLTFLIESDRINPWPDCEDAEYDHISAGSTRYVGLCFNRRVVFEKPARALRSNIVDDDRR